MYDVQEKKFLDGSQAAFNVAATWAYDNPLAILQQGTSASQRIGNRVFVHFIHYSIVCVPNTTIAVTGSQCRMVAFHDRECNGVTPTATGMWVTDESNTLRNSAKLPKFRIIRDMMHNMVVTATNAAAVSATGPMVLQHLFIPVKKAIQFSGNTGTVADILKDNYGLGYCAENGTACKLAWKVKVVFSDA